MKGLDILAATTLGIALLLCIALAKNNNQHASPAETPAFVEREFAEGNVLIEQLTESARVARQYATEARLPLAP